MLWETEIDEELEDYGVLGVKGKYSGANGIAEMFYNAAKNLDTLKNANGKEKDLAFSA